MSRFITYLENLIGKSNNMFAGLKSFTVVYIICI